MIDNVKKQMDNELKEVKKQILVPKQSLYNRMEDGDYEYGQEEDQSIMLGLLMGAESLIAKVQMINEEYEFGEE